MYLQSKKMDTQIGNGESHEKEEYFPKLSELEQ